MNNKSGFKLAANNKEREKYEFCADLYSIIKTVEYLEKAYVRDSISAKEFETSKFTILRSGLILK